jgi:periplasmic protein TonB
MGVYTHSEGNWLSRRGTFVLILIAFHLVLLWALKSGFAVKFIKSITEPIKAEIIDEVKPEEPPPPPPEVRMEMPPVQVPPILVDIPNPPEPPPTALIAERTTEPVPPQPPAPPAPPRAVVKVSAKPTSVPDVRDFYPSASINLKEEGTAKVRMCVNTQGRVATAEISEPTPFPRLNEAAIRIAKQFRFKAATEDGKAVESCVVLPVKFNVNDLKD